MDRDYMTSGTKKRFQAQRPSMHKYLNVDMQKLISQFSGQAAI